MGVAGLVIALSGLFLYAGDSNFFSWWMLLYQWGIFFMALGASFIFSALLLLPNNEVIRYLRRRWLMLMIVPGLMMMLYSVLIPGEVTEWLRPIGLMMIFIGLVFGIANRLGANRSKAPSA